jgi:hypothetical protein
MKLSDAIARIDPNAVRRVATECLSDVEGMTAEGLRGELETTIRSMGYVQPRLLGRMPPTYSILQCLLEAPERRLPISELRSAARSHAEQVADAVKSQTMVDAEEHHLYRRVLVAAWQTGLAVDSSELSLLGVLRNELGLHFVDHFLTLHHPDFWSYWRSDSCVERELAALMDAFIVFPDGAGGLCIPDELRRPVAHALGTPLTASALRRLYSCLTTAVLMEALRLAEMPLSGSKTERVERLVARMMPAHVVLEVMGIFDLQQLAEQAGCAKSGVKDTVIARLVEHFAEGRDLPVAVPDEGEVESEPKALHREQFDQLFGALTGKELGAVLERFDELPQSGTKSTRVETLWASRYSEQTLLSVLQNRHLEDILERCQLRIGGSKAERVMRLLEFGRTPQQYSDSATRSPEDPTDGTSS